MADEFITIGIETDPDTLAQEAFDYLALQIPGWEPSPGDPMTILIEAHARMVAERMDVDSLVPAAIFRDLGASLHNLPPIDASSASVGSTWTVANTAGYTIPAGTLVAIPRSGDEQIPFEVASDVVVAAGSSTTAAGEVILVALNPGADGSGLSGTPELIDTGLDFVTGITLVGVTTGGVDAEPDADYLDRLSQEFETLAPRPIVPRDFEILAKKVAGVDRATAIDGYNPADGSSGNERMVAVAIVDSAGAALGAGVKSAVDALLQAQREVTFVVNVIDPTFQDIDVTFTAVAHKDATPADVEAQAEAAVADYLSPANWGQPNFGERRLWENVTKVRYLEVAAVIDRVEGLDYISALTIGLHGGAMGTSDVTLTGVAPLTRPFTIAGTVTAP